jgi:hypothetical protein
MPTFQGQTDTEAEFRLQSRIIDAFWHDPIGYVQGVATLEIRTLYVSSGSPIRIQLRDKQGAPLERIHGTVQSNLFRKKIPLKDGYAGGIFFEVSLPEHGLEAVGPHLQIPGAVRLFDPRWDKAGTREEATRLKREMDVDVSVRIQGAPEGSLGRITFLEKTSDRKVHTIVSVPCKVREGKLTFTWRFDYPRATALLASQHEKRRTAEAYRAPKILFEATCHGARIRSGLLDFVDWFEVTIRDTYGHPVPGQRIKAILADGSIQERAADENGVVRIDEIPPGNTRMELLHTESAPPPAQPAATGAPAESAPELEEPTAPPVAAPVPPPVALATPPRVKGPIRLWVNAFIPEDIPGYTKKVRKGDFAGKTVIPNPWQLKPDGFLITDGRGFAETATAKSRFKTWASIRFQGSLPVLEDQTAFCDPLLELREMDLDDAEKGTAKPDQILWSGLTGTTDLIKISLDARACVPLLEGLPEIRLQGTFTIDLKAMTVAFKGKGTAFPAFEAYVRVRKGPANMLLQEPPGPGATPWDLRDGMKRSFEVEAKELIIS